MMKITVLPIQSYEAEPWLLKKHYARRTCPVSYAFGAYRDGELIGVVTYGLPASPNLCAGVCGPEYKDKVIELSRLCCENTKNIPSILVGRSLAMLPKPKIVVSFADTGQGHVGYIYQATNFVYTGKTDAGRKTPRADRIKCGGKHGRHQGRTGGVTDTTIALVYRKPKHRYVFFVGSKKERRDMAKALRYPVEPYPKGESMRYDASAKVQTQGNLFG